MPTRRPTSGRRGGRGAAAGFYFQDVYTALFLTKMLVLSEDAPIEVAWEKKGFDLGQLQGVQPIYVNDIILVYPDGRHEFLQVKASAPKSRWTIRNLIADGIFNEFWSHWSAASPNAQPQMKLVFASPDEAPQLERLIGTAQQTRTPRETIYEASSAIQTQYADLRHALGGHVDPDLLLLFLQSINVYRTPNLEELYNSITASLASVGTEASRVRDRLITIVGESKDAGQLSRSSLSRRKLIDKLISDGLGDCLSSLLSLTNPTPSERFPLMAAFRAAKSVEEVAEDIGARARAASRRLLKQMTHSKKYGKALYVERSLIETELKAFYASSKIAYALIGASGIGKTSLLCSLVDTSEQGEILFYSGSFLYPSDPARSCDIIHRLQVDLGVPSALSRANVIKYVEESALLWGKPLVVVIDGVNEYPSPEQILESVNEIIELANNSSIKIIISCRDHIWKEVTRTRKPYTAEFFNLRSDDMPSHYLQGFNSNELRMAYEKYHHEYQLHTPYSDLGEYTRKSFENPLILRMAAMAFAGKPLPADVPEGSVFDVFYAERIRINRDVERFLRQIVQLMRRARLDRLPATEVDAILSAASYRSADIGSPFHKLLELGILYEFEESGVSAVRFTYDRFFEYLLGKNLLEQGIEKHFRKILEQAAEFDSLRKGLESAILTYDRAVDPRALSIVRELAAAEHEHWREFAANCLGKMSWRVRESEEIIQELSADISYWVRWATGDSVRTILAHEPDRYQELVSLSIDTQWQRREVIATAIGGLTSRPEEGLKLLEVLALDDHWRVRRVVAFSVGELVALLPSAAPQVSYWADHEDWRVREALARSPRPLTLSKPELAEAVSGLRSDPEPIVRRAVARSMRVVAESAPEVSVTTLMQMKNDPDGWVRKTVLKAFASRALGALVDQLDMLLQFSSDPAPSIRWALVRTLRRIPARNRLIETLRDLAIDKDSFVAAAAEFSLALQDDPSFLRAETIVKASSALVLKYSNEVVYELAQDTSRLRKSREDRTKHWVPDEYLGIETAIAFLTDNTSGSSAYWPILNTLASDEDEGIRWGVTNLLGHAISRNRSECLKLLNMLAKDPHYWIRRAVAESVSQMRPEDALTASNLLAALATDVSGEVRLHVAAACSHVLHAGMGGEHILAAIRALTDLSDREESGQGRGLRQLLVRLSSDLEKVYPGKGQRHL